MLKYRSFKNMASRQHLVWLIVLAWVSPNFGLEAKEPVCTSRYDYEFKVMKDLVRLDIEQERNRDTLSSVETKLKKTSDLRKQDHENMQDLQSRVRLLEEGIKSVKPAPTVTAGTTYIRWGRTTCPGNGSDIVYKGFTAGSHYNSKGAATTYLCLPEDPIWNQYEDAEQTSAKVWGTEYESHYRNQQKFFGGDVKDKDAPCCVCYTNRPTVLMIPGRNLCYAGWTLEYQGYLVGGYDDHNAATEFVCLDEKPEALANSVNNDNGKLFYFAEATCGSLPCPPYVNGRELTCAVCSK